MSTSYRQDGPPKGGYGDIVWKRNSPVRGWSGAALIAGVCSFCAFNFYVALYLREKRQ